MKTHRILATVGLLLFLFPLFGQNCSDLENWGKLLETEFPNVNMASIRSGGGMSNRMLYNLYSDKYFLPVSNTAFDQLSSRARMAKAGKLKRCERRQTSLQQGTKLWLNYFGISPLISDQQAHLVKQKVVELRALRERYHQVLGEIEAKDLEYAELQRLKQVFAREYALLMPSEIQVMAAALESAGTELADKSLLAKANTLAVEAPTVELLTKLADFPRQQAALYQAATPAAKREATEIIEKAQDNTLAVTLKPQQEKLKNLSLTDPSELFRYILFKKEIQKTYRSALNHPRTVEFLEALKERTVSFVAAQQEIFSDEIGRNSDEKQIKDLVFFLDELNTSNPKVVALQSKARAKLEEVKNRRLESERKLAETKRKEKEAAQRKAQAQANAQKAAERRIATRRQQLRLKYGANLPTLEELFYVKALGLPIIGRVEESTKNKFINYVEGMGYMLTNKDRKLYKDSNRFKNRNGYRITTFRAGDDRGVYQYFNAALYIQNAPRDIVELYHQELVTLYRPHDQPLKRAYTGTPVGDFKSERYVKSGGTFYSLSVKDGQLTVNASDNYKAWLDVMAGEVKPGTIEVTGWTDKTHFKLEPGQKITLRASGQVKLGVFAGKSGPGGINGFQIYSEVKDLPHGALIGRFEGGEWFLVGRGGTFSSPGRGSLRLIINDKDRLNNSGTYLVDYSL